jgi:single-strand DNA-binding protein
MADLNKVMLLGRLTRDPQLRYTPSNQAVCEFGLAVGRKFKLPSGEEREETTFIDCTAWARSGEVINQYCRKGKQLFVEGRLKLDQWEDKQSGQKRSKLSVVIENFILLGGRSDDAGGPPPAEGGEAPRSYGRSGGYGGSGGETRGPARPAGGGKPAQPAPDAPFEQDQQHFKEDDIPF